MQILKYPLEITTKQIIDVPAHYEILSIQYQEDKLNMWLIDKGSGGLIAQCTIIIRGTGEAFETTYLKYLTTVISNEGKLVLHIFKQN